jgi:predicted MPP superfamily phosphohydrolase
MLSGHTHAGQLRLPLLGSPSLRYKHGYRYIKGSYPLGSMTLYVHSGLGLVYLPLRFLAPPEIALFHIRAK